eukprot:6470366-Amphidinium_carterae.1
MKAMMAQTATDMQAQHESSASTEQSLRFHLRQLLFILVEKLCNDKEALKQVPTVPVTLLPLVWTKVYGKDLNMLLQKCGFHALEDALQTVAGLHVTDGPERLVMVAPPSLLPQEK